MFLQGYPTSDKATSLASVRRDLEGSVVRDAAGKIRAGVFPSHTGELVARRPDMRLDILDFRAVQDKRGACFIANEGTAQSPVFAAAPAANRRIDVLYVTQRISTIESGDTKLEALIVQGSPSPTPTRPALPAQHADAIPLYAVEIPAGATSMQSGGVMITPLFPYTAAAGGTVIVRNPVELAAWKPADGGRAFSLSDSSSYLRLGGGWHGGSSILAQGNSYMNAGTQWGLSEKVSEQQSGIAIVWSAYSAAGATNQWSVDFIPKAALAIVGSGSGWVFKPGLNAGITKYLYVSDTQVSGYDPNGSAPNNQVALRYVIGV